MPTDKQKFNRKQNQVLKQSLKIDDSAVRKMRGILRDTRARIATAILDAEGFELVNLQAMKDAVDLAWREFTRQGEEFMIEQLPQAYQFGASMVDEPILAAGGVNAAIQLSVLPAVSVETVNAQVTRGAQFITNLSTEAAGKINNQILMSVMGEQSPNQAMKQIGNVLTDKSTFKTIADRAEAIVRTEVNSALNLGTLKRLNDYEQQFGGSRKYWIHTQDNRVRPAHAAVGRATNPDLGGTPIPVNRAFNVGGSRGQAPHDPALGAAQTVQCRCRLGFAVDEIKQQGVIQ